MQEKLNELISRAREEVAAVKTRPQFEAFKAAYVGPRGSLTALMKTLGQLPKEERPAAGRLINEAKQQVQAILDEALAAIERAELEARLGPPIDPTLPTPDPLPGNRHPITLVRDEICRILARLGFTVREGPEIETEYYCFDALCTPAEHPARDTQDTYYLPREVRFGNVSRKNPDERYLMRTHTSSVQIRTLLAEKPPVRILSPGRVFRRDTADATHSANFHQIEGLVVDRGITVCDLKATLDYLFQSLLGKEARTRFRPHYFGYTEPSFEVDFSAAHLKKLGREWVEIMGCGMVDPAVLEEVGLDPEEWSGFAFGLGVERIAMTLYGVEDIRNFYTNDVRFLRQFA
ncbi:MAG: phenylalanine--tRNA ligase subunit alpha [Verrucomicrobia bacterium]|nr:MAG: phenylalanine--tRNA ligase subunit alpha [Verrucomicrobiota bacterium]